MNAVVPARPIKEVLLCSASHLVTQVVIHEETWQHVETEHGNVTFNDVKKIIENCDAVVRSKQQHAATTLVLYNEEVRSTGSQTPLAVFVRVYEDKTAILRTAYNADASRVGDIVWVKGARDDAT